MAGGPPGELEYRVARRHRATLTVGSVDVAILFEKAVRELDVACALKHILARRHGLTTEIVQQDYSDASVLRALQPGVVVLPFCYQERSNNKFLIRWRESPFFNLTWEQLFYPGNATAKTPRGEFAVRHVIHNAWSQAYADLLRNAGVPDPHIVLTGNPAYTLYDEPYRRYFKSRKELAERHGLDDARPWVFFPENYNWAFYDQAMLDQMVRDGQPADQVMAMRRVVTQSFELAMRWCQGLLRRRDVELIIRPRPATPPEEFRTRVAEALTGLPRGMSITPDETVRDWILASDVVISSYSTSLIEATIAAKPAFILEPVPWPESLRQPWHLLLPRLGSEEDLVEVSGIGNASESSLGLWARKELMSDGDSILRLADEIARVRRGEGAIPEPPPWWSVTLPSRLPKRVNFELRRHIRPWLPVPQRQVRPENRLDMMVVREIPDRVRRWQPILDPYLSTLEPSG